MAVLTDLFTQIANAIREKTGDTANIQASQFATAIANIPSGSEVVVIKNAQMDSTTRTITNSQLVGKNNCVIMPTGINDNMPSPICGGGAKLQDESYSFYAAILSTAASRINYRLNTTAMYPTIDSTNGVIHVYQTGSTQTYFLTDWLVVAW